MRSPPQTDHRRAGPLDDEAADQVVEAGQIDRVIENGATGAGDELMEEVGDVVIIDDVAGHDPRASREEAAETHEDRAAARPSGEAEDLAPGAQPQPLVHPRIGAFVTQADQVGGGAVVVGRVARVERRAQCEQMFDGVGRTRGEEIGERAAGKTGEEGRDGVGRRMRPGGRRIAIRPVAHDFGPRLRDCQGQPLTQ